MRLRRRHFTGCISSAELGNYHVMFALNKDACFRLRLTLSISAKGDTEDLHIAGFNWCRDLYPISWMKICGMGGIQTSFLPWSIRLWQSPTEKEQKIIDRAPQTDYHYKNIQHA